MVVSASRFPFLLAVALVAAAIGDPLVETISNSGVFGRGYNDGNHLSVIPALVAGSILALIVIVKRALTLFHHGSTLRRGDWLVEAATGLSHRLRRRDLPLVLSMQFAALFAMESIEQLAFGGRLLGGTLWLGGPIAFSVATHAVVGSCCMLLLAALGRSILAAVASLVRETIDAILFSLARDAGRPFVKRRADASIARLQAPPVRQIGGRAPPRFPIAA